MSEVAQIIKQLDLKPHPEGGWYRETFRSKEIIPHEALPKGYSGSRSFSTCIYFLLTAGNHSRFHRIHQEEGWHFYKGDGIILHVLHEHGGYEMLLIGNDLEAGQLPQYVVPGGSWFAAEVVEGGAYGLVGCTVAPGFDFDDFELAHGECLADYYPDQMDLIRKLS